MRAAIYARVSKANGDQHPDNQVDALKTWAQRLGHELVHVYVDRQTGSTDDRPGLKAALLAAHRREFDLILVAALDRVSRGGVASLATILEKLAQAGVGIRSLREEWLDTSAPLTRELLVSVFAWIAKVERVQLVERTRAGLARARRDGKQLGRPRLGLDVERARIEVQKAGSIRAAALAIGCDEKTLRNRLARSAS